MCCVIKGLAVPLFMIGISSGGMKVAALRQKMDEIWMKAAAFEQKKGLNLDFPVKLA